MSEKTWWGVFRGDELLAVEDTKGSARWTANGYGHPAELSIAEVSVVKTGKTESYLLRNGVWIWEPAT